MGVTETEIITAMRPLHHAGYFVEPTTAAGAAGLTKLMADGTIRPKEKTVLVLTGTGLKAVDAIRQA